MSKPSVRTLSFPFAGVARRAPYRKQERPYATPYAINMRGAGTLESRERGGSRPGLAAVGAVTEVTEGDWQWPNGETLEWESGGDITFDYTKTNIAAPDGTEIINPASLIDITATVGTAPASYDRTGIYRDRVIAVTDNLWFASRMGDHTDWNYGADKDDPARAVAGACALAGFTGKDIIAIIPHRDKALLFAAKNALYVMHGDPATGRIEILDDDIGVIAPYGWAFNGEDLAFLSNDGVYVGGINSRPKRFSEERIPLELRSVDPDTNTITMAYDPSERGFHLFITPTTGTGSHYWLDVESKAIWPVVFGNPEHQPVLCCRIKSDSLEEVIFKCRDGVWRKFSADADDDDGTVVASQLHVGPVRLISDDIRNAILTEIHGLMANENDNVNWGVSMGATAEQSVDKARLAFARSSSTDAVPAGLKRLVYWYDRGLTVNGESVCYDASDTYAKWYDGSKWIVSAVADVGGSPTDYFWWMTDAVTVSGAGTTSANGIYLKIADINGNSAWYSGSYYIYRNSADTHWFLDGANDDSDPLYYDATDNALPSIDGWNYNVGDNPAPTLVFAVASQFIGVGTWSGTITLNDTPVYLPYGMWGELRSHTSRPRARGAWVTVVLSSVGKWAYEAMTIKSRLLGRNRI